MIGQTLSRYLIESQLGAGGMGVVYKGRDTVLGRQVAIKILPPEKVADPDRKRRFVQEARAASALNHPNITTIFDIGADAGRDFIVMEYVAGSTLDRAIPAAGMPVAAALKIATQIASALSAAHRAGIVHRDLKPSNVMLAEGGAVKVLDFGVAKLFEPQGSLDTTRAFAMTEEGAAVGTPAYMSPEQAEGRPVDARSDIFSFGSVLYEMVTGRRAFEGSSALSVLAKILKEEPPPPRQLVAGLQTELEPIILRCLRKDPDRRYQTMADLKVVLEDLAEGTGSSAAVPLQAHAPRMRGWWLAAAALPLLLAAIYLGTRSRESAQSASAQLHAVPLTSLPGQVRHPALSPDGDRVAFMWSGADGVNSDIYVQQIGAGAPLRLTTDANIDSSPAWSPDGRSIAFLRRLGSSNMLEVRLVPPLGGAERKVAELRTWQPLFRNLTLGWCPQASCVIVTDGQGEGMPDALFAFNLDGGRRQLTFPPAGVWIDADPAVAPDGRSLIFRRDLTPFTGEMYRLPLDGQGLPNGMPVRLTDVRVSATRPVWMPDGRNIMFSSKNTLWRMDAFGSGTPERLAFGLDAIQPAVSSPRRGEALKLVYVRVFSDSNIWRLAPLPGQASASAPQRVMASTRDDHFPRLSPDGRRLAFFSSRSGEFELWVADTDGSNAIQLTTLKSVPGFPRWSPDGRTLTFHSDPEGHPDVLTISADGGSPGIMTPGAITGGYPSFSRDGRYIYFTGPDPQGQQRIWRVAASGGAPVRITEVPGDLPIESLDGATLYYVEDAVRSSALWRLPLAGGPPAKVVDGVFNGNFDVTDKGIYFLQRDGRPPVAGPSGQGGVQTRLRYYEFATGKTLTIADDLGPVGFGLDATRDGRTIHFARIDASADELMLVDNFR